MGVTDIRKSEGGWIVTYKPWLRKEREYFTTNGTFFYDADGMEAGLHLGIYLIDVFQENVDFLHKRFWSDDHPSPSMRAKKIHEQDAQKARDLLK